MLQKQFNTYGILYYSNYNANIAAAIFCYMDHNYVGAISFVHNDYPVPPPTVGAGPLAGMLFLWHKLSEFNDIINLLRYDKRPLTLFIDNMFTPIYGGITTSDDNVGEALPNP